QIFFVIANMFLSASVGFCALTAMIRLFRAQKTIGNYFVDMWRVLIYLFLPPGLLLGGIFLSQGLPLTCQSEGQVQTLEPGAMGSTDDGQIKLQNIIVGPVAAVLPIKQIGTNGGGFYGANGAHPFENPTALSNFVTCLAMMLFPMALVLMFGRML